MADPLNYKKSGFPQRTSRSRAIAHGTKVPATVKEPGGYCARCGHTHEDASCKDPVDEANVASTGGSSKLPNTISPFKMRGG